MGDEVRSSSVGSFAPQIVGVVFDIAKEADALAVLKSVHRSSIDPDTKNILRDAVFEYRQNFDQAALTHACELFASVGMAVVGCGDNKANFVSSEPSGDARTVSRLGGGRKSAFGRPTTKEHHTSTRKSEFSTPLAASLQSPAPSHPPEPIVPTPSPKPVEEAVAVKIKIQTEPAPIASVENIPAAPSTFPSAPPVSQARPVDRINEIKKSVNEKVGNPVNLIDAHNDIGREYMNSLLEAMKKSNGGQAQELAAAMARLETAYASVLHVLDTPPALQSVAEPKPVPVVAPPEPEVPKPEPEPVPPPIEVPNVPTPVIEPSPPIKEPVVPELKFEPVIVPKPIEVPAFEPVAPSIASSAPTSAHVVQLVPEPPPTPKEEAPRVELSSSLKSPPNQIASVAKAKQVEELMHKQFVEAGERDDLARRTAEDKMDPIMVSEVTAGLRQLLSEWTLFKSSGLFGTGPSGIDHPLYKKINSIPMQAVIAGRFEGSTPQIRQSISDYMNGWRYEEGVVFDYGESFEHYLRRVIRHILDKKKRVTEVAK